MIILKYWQTLAYSHNSCKPSWSVWKMCSLYFSNGGVVMASESVLAMPIRKWTTLLTLFFELNHWILESFSAHSFVWSVSYSVKRDNLTQRINIELDYVDLLFFSYNPLKPNMQIHPIVWQWDRRFSSSSTPASEHQTALFRR